MTKRIYMPPRNVIGSLLPLAIATWYFVDKIGTGRNLIKVLIIVVAVAIQLLVVLVSTRTRKTPAVLAYL